MNFSPFRGIYICKIYLFHVYIFPGKRESVHLSVSWESAHLFSFIHHLYRKDLVSMYSMVGMEELKDE